MKPGNEKGLAALLARLGALAASPTFQIQRQIAMARAFHLYAAYGDTVPFQPTAGEVGLAELYLFADYYPEDGQLSLPEQVRDMIEVHVPEEERVWLDPLRHSYMDLLDVLAVQGEGESAVVTLRSLGNSREFQVPAGGFRQPVRAGQAVLTRLIRLGDEVVCAGVAVVLSAPSARSIFRSTSDWRLQREAEAGSFELGEWEEFAKRYGYVLLWNLAQERLRALIEVEAGFRHVTPAGQPFLYALALYEHHEPRWLAQGLADLKGWEPEGAPGSPAGAAGWVQHAPVSGESAVVARLTLTPSQLVVECDSRERLDQVKHELAAAFGFSLHCRGESTDVPAHRLLLPELDEEAPDKQSRVVTQEEEQVLLGAFLENVYLEWPDLPSPALNGLTPRHAAASPATRASVAALIDEIERHDIGCRRTGKPAHDYGRLRDRVGVEG
jgi:hypothetical protein